jgi:hypothetical protein
MVRAVGTADAAVVTAAAARGIDSDAAKQRSDAGDDRAKSRVEAA